MTTVQTALGPIATTELGPTLMHEHVVTRSPGVQENWPHLWDRNAILDIAERKMADLYRRGIRSIVDLTTVDLGRDIDLILGVARRSRVHIVVATGVWWMPQRYFSAHGVDAVADLFIRDITQGIGTSGVKAAIIKCATDTAGVTPVIDNVLRAAARAQKATGVPISTHTWAAGRTGELQQAIFAQEGVDLRRVIIGHSGDSEDLGYLRGLMERGSTIGMDRSGLEPYDELMTALLKKWDVPGAGLAVARGGRLLLVRGYGLRLGRHVQWPSPGQERLQRRCRPRFGGGQAQGEGVGGRRSVRTPPVRHHG